MLFDWTHIWWNAPNTITKYICSVQKTVNPHTHTHTVTFIVLRPPAVVSRRSQSFHLPAETTRKDDKTSVMTFCSSKCTQKKHMFILKERKQNAKP